MAEIRVVALLDVDHFEVQVRGKSQGIRDEKLQNDPCVVEAQVFFITCVNQRAKDLGAVRGSPLESQKLKSRKKITVIKTPRKYGKPENLSTKKAGDDIYESIASTLGRLLSTDHDYYPIVEKSNCDEFYIDLTYIVNRMSKILNFDYLMDMDRNFKVYPYEKDSNRNYYELKQDVTALAENNKQLYAYLQGAEIVGKILDDLKKNIGFTVSAGIGGNKLMAKLACHGSKPNGLAVLPEFGLNKISKEIELKKLPGFGGTVGARITERFKHIKKISDFRNGFYKLKLWRLMGTCNPKEIYQKCIGIDNTPVIRKSCEKKLTCGKSINTNAKNKISTKTEFIYHLHNRFHEMRDNILYEFERRQRIPKTLKLEIYRRSRYNRRHILFRNHINFPHKTLARFERWKEEFSDNDDLREWHPIIGKFKKSMNEKSLIAVFCNDSFYISQICRISLVAFF